MKYQYGFPSVSIEKAFEKSLLKIPQINTRENIRQAIEKLADNPRPFGTKPFKQLNPPIGFYEYTAHYRIRIGDYRVLYDVDDEKKIVWILALRRRREETYKSW